MIDLFYVYFWHVELSQSQARLLREVNNQKIFTCEKVQWYKKVSQNTEIWREILSPKMLEAKKSNVSSIAGKLSKVLTGMRSKTAKIWEKFRELKNFGNPKEDWRLSQAAEAGHCFGWCTQTWFWRTMMVRLNFSTKYS